MLATINDTVGLNLNLTTYMRLGATLNNYFSNRPIGQTNQPTSIALSDFIVRFKKGSSPFRKVMSNPNPALKRSVVKSLDTFARLTNCDIDIDARATLLGHWNSSLYPNRIRDFLFKFTSNKLPLNNRLSHFTPNIDRSCTFCKTRKLLPPPEETFLHLFWDCPYTQEIYHGFVAEFVPEIANITLDAQKTFWFTTYTTSQPPPPPIYAAARSCLMFLLWENHNKKSCPSWHTLKIGLCFELSKIIQANHENNTGINCYNFSLCRQWTNLSNRYR